MIVWLGPALLPVQIGGSHDTEINRSVWSPGGWLPSSWFQITKISWTWTGTVSRFVMVMLMEDPDFAICPCVILISLQPVTVGSGVGLDVGVGVFVGVSVMVGVKDGVGLSVAVGLSVTVGVRDGVSVNIGVSVGVEVGVSVGGVVGVSVGGRVLVGMAVDRSGVLVTTIAMPMTIVRALIPRIGSPLATERSIKGTNFGTIGKKSP